MQAHTHGFDSLEKKTNNIDENQHLQNAAIQGFHLKQSLNISFIMLACSNHPHSVSSIFLHFLLLFCSKKMESVYHLLSMTRHSDTREGFYLC